MATQPTTTRRPLSPPTRQLRKSYDILTEDLEDILADWDKMRGYLEVHVARRRREEAIAAIPMPRSEPDAIPPSDPPPTEQAPQAKVGRRPAAD